MSQNISDKQITHIAIIPDGNRRWAKSKDMKTIEGHKVGIDKIEEVAKWAHEHKIKHITFWGFSTDNNKRTREEVEELMKLFEFKFEDLKKRVENMLKNKEEKIPQIRLKFYGDIKSLPSNLIKKIEEIENKTKDYQEVYVNILLNYGGKDELFECIKNVAEDYKKGKITEINENEIMKRLWTGELPYPEIIIRTSGEARLSGLFPLQSGYSELFFVYKMWPEFSKKDFENIIDDFNNRDRRFGK
jgi:tritrans,polycis-undecaprenyl-diphosphate synthase [geranylgeranyl-diphosphate specific]